MATVVHTYWVDPLTGSHVLPTEPGNILQTAVSYWEDQVMEWRVKRPRKPADKLTKEAAVEKAAARIQRFSRARDQYATDLRKLDKVTLALATQDLREVMKT